MDRFPDDYVAHNLPLLLLSGLSTATDPQLDLSTNSHTFLREGGFRIQVDVPVVQGPLAESLLQSFREQDASGLPWHSRSLSPRNGRAFKILSVGRVYTLPPRKAPPPPHSPRLSAAATGSPPSPLVLHSPLSPLTPSSPLYPDGLISPLWITKHQSRLPCAFLFFFTLASDTNSSSLQDNKLKSEINSVRNLLSSTNYKTKLVVILLGDGPNQSSDLEERVANLRRATGLDGKAISFLGHDSSPAEVSELVGTVLSSLHPICVEYYRDLSKHTRRKRNRNSAPPPTVPPGTAHILSHQGWNVRYEFKLGVFAEFRQEMDAACRNYETAYDSLFAPEIIEAIAVWSPRFNEARLLADIIAFRTIRCLLWLGQGTTAVRSWLAHRDRIRDLVNRRGKGTDNYGWEAWQSAWAKVMADLLARSEYPLLNTRIPDAGDVLPIFAEAEKSLPSGERFTPWEQLHHEGYWLDIAKRCTSCRRKWALQVPEEDRQSPGRSPASLVASKAHLYDTYLSLEPYLEVPADGRPGYNYADEIVSTLGAAIHQFTKRGQMRKKEILELQTALELIQTGSWPAAVHTLRPLWSSQSWRHAGWWKLLQGLGWALLDCLDHVKDPELQLQVLWELSNRVFDPKPGTNYDLRHAVVAFSAEQARPSVAIDIDETLSPLVAAFAFSTHDVFVGEPLECQLSIESRGRMGMPPVEVNQIKVVFEGSLKPIYLVAGDGEAPPVDSPATQFIGVCLDESSTPIQSGGEKSPSGVFASQTGVTDLTIPSNHTKIFRFQVVPREAGEASVASITMMINDESFTLAMTSSDFGHSVAQWWESKGGFPVPRTLGLGSNAYHNINVQPKPPKLQIRAPGLRQTYYTNESIHVDFDIVNEEEGTAVVSIEARMISPVEGAGQLKWTDQGLDDALAAVSEAGVLSLPRRELGTIASLGESTVSLCVFDTTAAVDYEIEVVARYSLVSEPETMLSRSLAVDVGVIRPFEANYDFVPRLDHESWPNFFAAPPPDTDSSTALGLRHLYAVAANLYSFALDPLAIEAILLTATKITGGAVCSSSTGIVRNKAETSGAEDAAPISSLIRPDQTETFDFDLSVQKLALGDRHAVGVDLALEIGWRRQDSAQVNTTVLEVPKLVAPMAEPRVMLTTSTTRVGPANLAAQRLMFTIENPSMHFLTFNVSMDASEDFAFSGPKACALSLVPISRQTLRYQILPNKTDQWIGVHLTVVDAYFGQTLRVLPGGEGVRVDKKGDIYVKV